LAKAGEIYYIPLMNIFKYLVLCFLATAFAFAQEQPVAMPLDSLVSSSSVPVVPEPVVLEVAPISSSSQVAISLPPPASSSSSAAEGKTIFDSLRGRAYNPYATPGAAPTVGDLVIHPSDINGQKFFYVSPTNRVGYVAFGFDGGSAMLGLDRSLYTGLPALVLGYANSAFGIAFNYSVDKEWTSDKNLDLDMRFTSPGDNIGLYISVPINSTILYANANWTTYGESYYLDYNNNKTTADYSTINANLGLTGNSGSLAYDVYLNGIRGGCVLTVNGEKLIDATDSSNIDPPYWGFALNLDLGNTVLQNSVARVIIGANSSFYMMLYDKANNAEGYNKMGASIIPTILAEVSLFDNWIAFTGAGYALSVNAGDDDRDDKTSKLVALSEGGAFGGIRYQKTNWAVEAQISTNMFNNPFGGFNGSNMFAEFGGFIYF